MDKRFVVTPNLCTGCRTCELACAFSHSVNGKPGLSRIYPLSAGTDEAWVPVVCLQCENAACVKACLVDAIARNPETGALELDYDRCVRCMACVAACPFGCSLPDDQHSLVVKCDLCGGEPVCAMFCPTKALAHQEICSSDRKSA
ncbi:MAG: 4Fe-4S dicluster domain-containing protein [Candidatus Zixiibacteriota bacterium]|nr:MAG: 4Fe-4S dicluster domain-containing protein [candidate division Zixibacteria bacterium]